MTSWWFSPSTLTFLILVLTFISAAGPIVIYFLSERRGALQDAAQDERAQVAARDASAGVRNELTPRLRELQQQGEQERAARLEAERARAEELVRHAEETRALLERAQAAEAEAAEIRRNHANATAAVRPPAITEATRAGTDAWRLEADGWATRLYRGRGDT